MQKKTRQFRIFLLSLLSLSKCNGRVLGGEQKEIIASVNSLIINKHADLIYILPRAGNTFTKLSHQVSQIHQVAFLYNESAFLNGNVSFSRDFSVTNILVQKSLPSSTCHQIFNQRTHNSSQFTWIFSARSYITKIPRNLKLMDQLYYFQNSRTIREVYKIKELVIEQEVNTESLLSRRINLQRTVIDTAHVRQPAFTSKSGKETLRRDWPIDRLTYQKLAFMQDVLNCSVRFHNVSYWVTSSTQDGIGMADAIRMNLVDLALSNTALWNNVEFRFLFITYLYREVYVYYHPPPSAANRGFEWVVQPIVWLFYGLLAGTLFLISPLFFTNDWDFGESFSWTVSVLTERGVTEPQSRFTASARCFFFTSLAFGLLFYVSLSSILISILSVKIEISGMEELQRRGYSFGVWKESALDDALKAGTIPERSPLAVVQSKYRTFVTEEEGAVEVVSKKKFAFVSGQLMYIAYANFIEKIGGCKAMKLFTLHGEKRWGSVFVPRDSPFTNHFNFGRLRMSERGIESVHLRNIKRDTEAVKEVCLEQNKTPPNHPIGMEEVVAILYIYILGILVTIPVFLVERFKKPPPTGQSPTPLKKH